LVTAPCAQEETPPKSIREKGSQTRCLPSEQARTNERPNQQLKRQRTDNMLKPLYSVIQLKVNYATKQSGVFFHLLGNGEVQFIFINAPKPNMPKRHHHRRHHRRHRKHHIHGPLVSNKHYNRIVARNVLRIAPYAQSAGAYESAIAVSWQQPEGIVASTYGFNFANSEFLG